jgi:hypothetical protein
MHQVNDSHQRSDHDEGIKPGGLGGRLIPTVCKYKMVTGAKLEKQNIIN